MFGRKKIHEVFTPREPEINKAMYIHRPDLEEDFKQKLLGVKHIIVYGESGCGKSWLYRKQLEELKKTYIMINLSVADRRGSIAQAFKEELANLLDYEKVEYTDTKKAGIDAVVANGELEHQNVYQRLERDPVREFVKITNKKNALIVLDNLEAIYNQANLMKELGSILMLQDDPNYRARFLIVGTPSGVMQYFRNTDLLKPIANRIEELKEVKGLNPEQVNEFVEKGFNKELKAGLGEKQISTISSHVFWVTSGIPDKVQEYCEKLAFSLEKNKWIFDEEMLHGVDIAWVQGALHANYVLINSMMNSKETEIGRRNQVLYCLGMTQSSNFKAADIENLVRREFPNSTAGKLSISTTLNDIVEWKNSFISKNGYEYTIKDKQCILCIRMMLKKTSEKVEKIDIQNLG